MLGEEQATLVEQRRLRKKEEMEAHKTKYEPLLKFMKANGMKLKEAAVKKHSVQYFRVDQFKAFLETKQAEI